MPIAYNITKTNEKGKPLKIERKKDKKLVKGWKVDWVDAKGEVHHDGVEIYIRGKNKGYPKTTLHGALTSDGRKRADDLPEARKLLDISNERKKIKSKAKKQFASKVHDKLKAEFPSYKRFYSGKKHATELTPKYYGGSARKRAIQEFSKFNQSFNDTLMKKYLKNYNEDDDSDFIPEYVAPKSWDSMTEREKINHMKNVLIIRNAKALRNAEDECKKRYKDLALRRKRLDAAIKMNYNKLSAEIRKTHLP